MLFVRSSCQILLPRFLRNGLNSFDKTDREYSLAHTDDLLRFLRSKVKVTASRRDGEVIHVDVNILLITQAVSLAESIM